MSIVRTGLTLKDLPPPSSEKQGWPWTEESSPIPDRMPDGLEWPRISIITPSYNQGQFIEETIRSILLQGYPNLEYILIDGGSTDNTIEILKRYEPYFSYWVSEPDAGQSDAINKGFHKTTGELIAWQNSDDYYAPDVFIKIALATRENLDADVFYGAANVIDSQYKLIQYLEVTELNVESILPWFHIVNQSCFFKRKNFQLENFVSSNFSHFMDYELFWRLLLEQKQFQFIPGVNSYFRIHQTSKGSTQDYRLVAKELAIIYKMAYEASEVLLPGVRKKALECSRGLYLDNFANYRFAQFREGVVDLISRSGLRLRDSELYAKYFVSLLGITFVKKLKQFL
ncbi:glycosyltransferase family 2 protein [Kamptonema cortianum]|uniref:Glycosyltransferase family 2 protein n=1 Tax=Geitlerinema calcuttense NRMC-F 0142 TaxID=2922238 RepID=A0ABT7LY95_9CYAN|nr:glycosyltransferase family 2 protein [Geitlerinema calcuttense]MDK3157457.1 glycosyltransferase family 2 protein [Kamptonema cortianum]MDL5056976.1 glycosyltransferase family 2 protein [Geitlerinema calcuttense NRMC-F 0142]